MSNQVSPESRDGVPTSWYIPIGRKPVVKTITGAGLAIASQFLLPDTSIAQHVPKGNYGENEFALSRIWPGWKSSFLYSHNHWGTVEDLGDFLRLRFPSSFPDRPHELFGEDGGEVLAKRVINHNTAFADNYNTLYGKPHKVIEPPKYQAYQPGVHETRILKLKDQWMAAVVNKNTGAFMETQTYLLKFTMDDIVRLSQADFAEAFMPQAAPSAEPAAKALKIGFLAVDGLDSVSSKIKDTFDPIIKVVNPDLVAPFSHNGWEIQTKPGTPNELPEWIPKPYVRQDTRVGLLEKWKLLRGHVEELGKYVDRIYMGGFSEGSFIIWQYLVNELLRKDSSHKGLVTKALLMAGPLAGVDHQLAPYVFGIFGDNVVSNDNTEVLAAFARTPELFIQNVNANKVYARRLKEEAGVDVMTVGSINDCIVTYKSAVIEGSGKTFDLPRALPDCTASILKAAWEGGDIGEAAGHTNIIPAVAEDARVFYRG